MPYYHLGINLGHDRAVALVRDGEIVTAIQQERLDRYKHSLGFLHQSAGNPAQIQVPNEAIQYCLENSGIKISDLATITGNMPGIDYSPSILKRAFFEHSEKIKEIPSHHLAHAYTAYWPSGFDESLVLVADGSGTTGADNRTESYSLYLAQGTEIKPLHLEAVPAHLANLFTLGFIYEYISRKAGFATQAGSFISVPESGKLMGLAPYGGPQEWHRWIKPQEGSYSLSISAYDIFLEVAALEKFYDNGQGKPYLRPYMADLAWKVQKELEEALSHIVDLAIKNTGVKKLCLAGGVALNSVANYKLYRQLQLEDIFIFPAAGDSGVAAGCALWAYAGHEGGKRRVKMRAATLGRGYSLESMDQALKKFSGRITFERLSKEQVIERSAQAISNGHILARFEGGSEYGPRALGHRSIIADPTFERMKDILNARVKHREAFRPFAPVIPESEVEEVFEQQVSAPFMLLVSEIKPKYREKIPAVTHYDGTGRVQTVTEEDNPFFHAMCFKLKELRGGPPVLLNTSFNVSNQPIVETPREAIETFLGTDIDFLVLEDLWISKKGIKVLNYSEHLKQIGEQVLPCGLAPNQSALTVLMHKLDRALFWGETENCPWTREDLSRLASEGARYKETSSLFTENPLGKCFASKLSQNTLLLLDPLGKSALIDLTGAVPESSYSFNEIKWLIGVLGSREQLEKLRIQEQLTTREAKNKINWAIDQLRPYRLKPENVFDSESIPDSILPAMSDTFGAFSNSRFSARRIMDSMRNVLDQAGYTEGNICNLLGLESLQRLEPTHHYYYDRFRLGGSVLDDLVRLFQLRAALPEKRLKKIFGERVFDALAGFGLFIRRGGAWASRVDIFCADGLYVATDHRYMLLEEDRIDENPVMYIGMDSMGLVHSAPRVSVDRVLDLCTGSGIQALAASRYAHIVIGADINPRAVRFARFNAQINGIENVEFIQGNLYQAVSGKSFDLIIANPPFVPSPRNKLRFRDGGAGGEDILDAIVSQAADHLTETGKLHIVTDLVNLDSYNDKLRAWWTGGAADILVLHTADRDEILFSVPHTHAPFGQSLEEYNSELEKWVLNFRDSGLKAVNFGYIFIHRRPDGSESYYERIIHNPSAPIHGQVKEYFQLREKLDSRDIGAFYLALNEDISFRMEFGASNSERRFELFCQGNPYYTTYVIDEELFSYLQMIASKPQRADKFIQEHNRALIEDLLFKGVLRLVSNPGPRRIINPQEGEPPKANPVHSMSRNNMDSSSSCTIKELATKTTPTCLSSYLRC